MDPGAINQPVIWVETDAGREQTEAHGQEVPGRCCGCGWDTTGIAVVDGHDDGVFSMRAEAFLCCDWLCRQKRDP